MRQEPKSRRHGLSPYIGAGIAIGLSMGVALSIATHNFAFIGSGVAIGMAMGVALSERKKR